MVFVISIIFKNTVKYCDWLQLEYPSVPRGWTNKWMSLGPFASRAGAQSYSPWPFGLMQAWELLVKGSKTYVCSGIPTGFGTRHGTPRSTLHFPVTGSGGPRLMNGGSSRNPTVRWNFSGTPCGGMWLWPGQTMSLMSRPLFSSW